MFIYVGCSHRNGSVTHIDNKQCQIQDVIYSDHSTEALKRLLTLLNLWVTYRALGPIEIVTHVGV